MAKKKEKLPPFVPLTWNMLNSTAYIALRPSSAKALPHFVGKGKNTMDGDRIFFSFSYREAKRHGFSQSTFHNIISDLISKGFVDPVFKGGLRGYKKSCSQFALSTRWKDYGEEDFREISWEKYIHEFHKDND